jgi:hypothetical protein
LDWLEIAALASIVHHAKPETIEKLECNHMGFFVVLQPSLEFLFGTRLLKQPNESWQAWETRMARFFGVHIASVHVRASAGSPASPGDEPVLDLENLAADVASILVPILIGKERDQSMPKLTEQGEALVAFLRRLGREIWPYLLPVLVPAMIAHRTYDKAQEIVQRLRTKWRR